MKTIYLVANNVLEIKKSEYDNEFYEACLTPCIASFSYDDCSDTYFYHKGKYYIGSRLKNDSWQEVTIVSKDEFLRSIKNGSDGLRQWFIDNK